MVADCGSIDVCDIWPYVAGQPVANWAHTAWLKASSSSNHGSPDDVLQNYLMLPVFSRNLRQRLYAENIGNIQYLPIHLYLSDGRPIDGYCIANVLDCVPALDLQQSRLSRFGPDWAEIDPNKIGHISGVSKPVLKASELLQHDIIRTEEYTQQLFVSARFRKLFLSGRFTGYDFRKVALI